MQSEALKPCPFCGYALTTCEGICEGYVDGSEEEEVEFTGICCPGCAVFLPKQTENGTAVEGIQAWNRRSEAALSAAEPVGWQWRNPRWTVGGQWQHCPDGPREDKLPGTEYRPVYAAPPAPSVAVKAILAELDNVLVNDEQDREPLAKIRTMVSALSAQVQDVAGWERVTIETGRKSGTSHTDVWPDGEGWEIDTDRGRVNTPDAGWDRFSNHEELYFRRRANELPAAPAKQEGKP